MGKRKKRDKSREQTTCTLTTRDYGKEKSHRQAQRKANRKRKRVWFDFDEKRGWWVKPQAVKESGELIQTLDGPVLV